MTTGMPSLPVGTQTGLLAALANLGQNATPTALGLQTDFANPNAVTVERDGPSLYGYARQSPLVSVDPEGLNPGVGAIAVAVCLRSPAACGQRAISVARAAVDICRPLIVAMGKLSGKERSKDRPSKYEGMKSWKWESGKDFAERIIDPTDLNRGANSDWSKMQKFGDRYPENLRKIKPTGLP